MGVEGLLDGFGLSDWNRVQNPQVFVESSRISNEAASGLGVMGAYDSGLGVAVCALSACYVLEVKRVYYGLRLGGMSPPD